MSKKKNQSDWAIIMDIMESWVLHNLSFVLFLGFMGMIYIANVHYAEQKIRRIEALQRDIKELRWEYMSLKSELMYNSKKTEVEKRVEHLGLANSGESPKKILDK